MTFMDPIANVLKFSIFIMLPSGVSGYARFLITAIPASKTLSLLQPKGEPQLTPKTFPPEEAIDLLPTKVFDDLLIRHFGHALEIPSDETHSQGEAANQKWPFDQAANTF